MKTFTLASFFPDIKFDSIQSSNISRIRILIPRWRSKRRMEAMKSIFEMTFQSEEIMMYSEVYANNWYQKKIQTTLWHELNVLWFDSLGIPRKFVEKNNWWCPINRIEFIIWNEKAKRIAMIESAAISCDREKQGIPNISETEHYYFDPVERLLMDVVPWDGVDILSLNKPALWDLVERLKKSPYVVLTDKL